MSKKKNSWLGRDLSSLFLAPLLVLIGILLYGILFDQWFKDPMMILEFSGLAYAAILVLRILRWIIKALST